MIPQHFVSKCMDRPLAVGGASGALTSALLGLAHSFFSSDFYLERSLEVAQQVCACSDRFEWEEIPWAIFGCGFLAGIFFGPLLDICWVLREKWRRFIWNRFFAGLPGGQTARTSPVQYKVIA